jgi:hypothetical protein
MKFIKYFIIELILGGGLTYLITLYSQDTSAIGWMDALLVAGVLLFSFGWFFFISNNHVFDIVLYGFQSFWKRVLGRGGMEKDYYTTISEKSHIPISIFGSLWVSGAVYIFAGIIYYINYL